jgi:hypothetical protein
MVGFKRILAKHRIYAPGKPQILAFSASLDYADDALYGTRVRHRHQNRSVEEEDSTDCVMDRIVERSKRNPKKREM